MKIYTRTGDKGQTSLFSGERVAKNHDRIEAYGCLDELNSVLGVTQSIIHILKNQPNMTQFTEDLQRKLTRTQNILFVLGSHLATATQSAREKLPGIPTGEIAWLEEDMDVMNQSLPELKSFILPGGGRLSAHLHLARTICRRAERLTVKLSAQEQLDEFLVTYLNRMGDWLFVLARFANQAEGHSDLIWTKP